MSERSIGVPGIALVLVGAALTLVAFRFLDWYSTPSAPRRGVVADSAGNATFAKLHASADGLGGAAAARAYFDWLAWTVLIALIVVGVAAALPVPFGDALRVAGFLLGLLGVGASYFAVAQLNNAQADAGGARHDVLYHSTWGLWATFAGFLIAAIGAVLGPRGPRPRPAEEPR